MSISKPHNKAPNNIKLHKRSQILEVQFEGETFELSSEYLRVHSPSAEVRGHGNDQAILQYGKSAVCIANIEAQGHYAIRLIFDDGHDSGIYTWAYLYELGKNKEALWDTYLAKLKDAGKTRDADTSVIQIQNP